MYYKRSVCLSVLAEMDLVSTLKFSTAPQGLHVVTQLILVERVAGGSGGQRGDRECARGGWFACERPKGSKIIIADAGMFRLRVTQRTDGISVQLDMYAERIFRRGSEGRECVVICVAGGCYSISRRVTLLFVLVGALAFLVVASLLKAFQLYLSIKYTALSLFCFRACPFSLLFIHLPTRPHSFLFPTSPLPYTLLL
jgi:hypothetical protein